MRIAICSVPSGAAKNCGYVTVGIDVPAMLFCTAPKLPAVQAAVFVASPVAERRYLNWLECMSKARWTVPSRGEIPMQMTLCESVDVVR